MVLILTIVLALTVSIQLYVCTVVSPYLWGIPSKTPSGFLKPETVLNPMYTMFFPTHTYV